MMTEENKQKARERMQAMHAAKKGIPIATTPSEEPVSVPKPEVPAEDVTALKARIAELEGAKATPESMKKDKDREIIAAYQSSHRSIQDVARIFDVTVDHVLHLIGHGNLASVTFQGDMVDAGEAGPGATMNYGQTAKVPYTVN